MFALLSLKVCMVALPLVCEEVVPDYVYADSGQPPTFMECQGAVGQSIAARWIAEHPQYVLRAVRCSIGNSAEQLRATIEQPEA